MQDQEPFEDQVAPEDGNERAIRTDA